SWNDKPVLATSDDGKDVYITFNGPTGGDPWIAQSHDSGGTWAQSKLVDSARYFFAFDADVAADGTVYLAQSSLLYGGGGDKGRTRTPPRTTAAAATRGHTPPPRSRSTCSCRPTGAPRGRTGRWPASSRGSRARPAAA